ncbi:MAG TPA: hypothetical protein VGY55_13440 [Pirellulales bacterium]|jgi:hypothetical protein|nr:hypothetical protein [Pirellulales bacterium]
MILFAADETGAPPAAKPDEPKVVKVVLHPAKPPAAALQFPLLPRFVDQYPGNAATLYAKAAVLLVDKKDPNELWDKIDRWLELPPAEMPREEVEKAVVSHQAILKIVTMAAHRDRCDWEPPIREDDDIFGILLPEVGPQRNVARLLALKARMQISEGHLAQATETLQTGYVLARHTADCPFLISGLVGVAISNIMDKQVLTLIQSPNCPNLYWSITALPSPLVDLRPAFEFEKDDAVLAFPELRGVERAQHSPEEWAALLVSFGRRVELISGAVEGDPAKRAAISAAMAGAAILRFDPAKADLVASGRDRKAVDAMPAAQVILLHTVLLYDVARDEMFKWFNVPYWQAQDGMAQSDANLKNDIRQRELVPLASLILPAIANVRKASVRSERRIALLRVIEALRFYAADHDGMLPAALDEIKEVPLPVDPVTGKPFGYTLADGKATLDAPPPAGVTWEQLGARCEITIAASK